MFFDDCINISIKKEYVRLLETVIRIQVGSGFNSVCGFGSRKTIMTLKKEKRKIFYEELDLLLGELEASPKANNPLVI
jgi:hypothetical protein